MKINVNQITSAEELLFIGGKFFTSDQAAEIARA